MIQKLFESLLSICPENIKCKNNGCNLMHPRCFAGICIHNLNGNCKKPCPKNLIHISKGSLKEKLQMHSINGVFVINLCPTFDCKNSNCYYLHRDWIQKRNICIKYLKNNDDCEGECEKNQKHVDWQQLQSEVFKEYEYMNLSPETMIVVDKIYYNLEKYCIKYFKGICDYKGICPKFHVDWEKVKYVSAKQFERKKLVPCTRSQKPEVQRMDSKSFTKLELLFEKQNLKKLQHDIRASNILDIVFIMDCTGSMDPWINQARESISEIINIFNKAVSQTQIRIAFVGYRDFKDEKHIQYHDFTTDVELIKSYISTVQADGGDDDAEDLAGGISQVLKLDFSKHSQSILCTFLICDAPTHGKQYHDYSVSDKHNDCIQEGSLENLMQILDQKKTPNNYFFCCKLNETTNQMFEIMKQNFKNLEISQLETKDFTNYVSISMIKSFQSSCLIQKNISQTQKFQAHFIWHKVIEPVECTYKNQLNYFSNFLTQMGQQQIGGDTILEIEMNEKQLNSNDNGKVSYIFEAFDIRNNLNIIIKLPKKVVDQYKKGQVDQDMIQKAKNASHVRYNQTLIAKQLSSAYRYQTKSNNKSPPIFYVTPIKYTLCSEFYGLKDLYAETKIILNGPWEKISNNTNFIDKEKENYSAFSHFTYHFTNRSLVITDLQGKQGVLSDPCIHTSKVITYLIDETNHGDLGIQRFFSTQHNQCNEVCKFLGLQRNDDDDKIPENRIFTQLQQLNIQNVNAICNVCNDIFQINYDKYKGQIDNDDTCQSCTQVNELTEICECCGNQFKFNLNRVLKQALDLKICEDCQRDCLDQRCNQCALQCALTLQKQPTFCKQCDIKEQCFYCSSKCARRNIKRKVNDTNGESKYLCEEACQFFENLYCFECLSAFSYQNWPSQVEYVKGEYKCYNCQNQ